MMQKRKLEELNLLDDFLFGSMVTHPEVGERFVRKLLRIIFGREFNRLKVFPQKTYYGKDTDKHGTRLDVYLEEEPEPGELNEGTIESGNRVRCSDIYDVEPDQNSSTAAVAALPKRIRFYHGIIDAQLLRSGADYDSLKNVTVIIIVPYDPFGHDRMVYTIARKCRELPDMPYDDGSQTLYLYTRGKEGDCPEGLRQLLHYMEETTRENAVNDDLRQIQQMVECVKMDEGVSIEYMKSYEREWLIRKEEQVNTERERMRAVKAEEEAARAKEEATKAEEKATKAEEKATKAEEKATKAEEKATKAEEKVAEANEETAAAKERAEKAEARIRELQEELERVKRSIS